MPEPFGFGFYEQLMKLRWGENAVRLTAKSYSNDPLRAYEIALGIKPAEDSVVSLIRKRRQEQLTSQSSTAREIAERTEKNARQIIR